MTKVALLIDGGHLRQIATNAGKTYDPQFIEKFAHSCIDVKEQLHRILYYDCPQYRGRQKLPVSGALKDFTASDKWLDELAEKELFAVRRGTLAFRGWVPKSIPIAGHTLSDTDFRPNFEQKGVDMRIGLDIAVICDERRIDRIIIVSADTDLIPAMKHARKAGLQIVAIQLPVPPAIDLRPQYMAHADFKRKVALP